MRTRIVGLCLLVLAGTAWCQPADFGDLPDPTYPSVLASSGPYHLDTTHEAIGSMLGTTTLEADALIPDADLDDGYIRIRQINQNGVFDYRGRVEVPVSTDGDDAIRYLNVLADINADGQFAAFTVGLDTQYEWIAVNVPIIFMNEIKVIVSDFPLLLPLPGNLCARATLTTVPIKPNDYGASGWDGTGPLGGFARGETEDFCTPPWVDFDHEANGTGVRHVVHIPPPPPPPFPPPPGRKTGYRGGGHPPPPVDPPSQPPNPPIDPPTTAPPRYDDGEAPPVPRSGATPVSDMPDIKQGLNECAPTAAANSVRYLMNKAGLAEPGDHALDDQVREALKEAMGTTAEEGTECISTRPGQKNFFTGKQNANLPGGIQNRLTTVANGSPTAADICNAVNSGKDVEISLAYYPPGEGTAREPLGHMVTVVGCVKRDDGSWEIKYHDPGDIDKKATPPEQPGQNVQPPREHSIIVDNGGQDDRGGLRVRGTVKDKNGRELVRYIEMAYVEELAQEGNLGASAAKTTQPAQEGQPAAIRVNHGKAEGYYYQWLHNGIDLEWGLEDLLSIPAMMPEDEGQYVCWVYDGDGTFQWTNEVTLSIGEEEPSNVPAAGFAALAGLSTALAGLYALRIGRPRTRRK